MGVNYASDKTKEKEISVENHKEATRSNPAKLGNMHISTGTFVSPGPPLIKLGS